ncbi:MAG: FAD/NAD(P)-binding protein [Bacteroidota bacterium]
MKRIGIIGGGFSGTMTAVNLMISATKPIEIIAINEKETFNKGVAFNPYSKAHLLNVITSKMTAFSNEPEHFLNWVMKQNEYENKDRVLIANSYLPRYLYGQYLSGIWTETTKKVKESVKIKMINAFVIDMDVTDNSVTLTLNNNEKIVVDSCVIASGNNIPRNPDIKNNSFYANPNYFQNPWDIKSVSNTDPEKPILIIGNGLTMVDTVMGLLEHGFKNEIYSISSTGFNILPHRHNGFRYTKLVDELPENVTLLQIVKLFNKHVKQIREFGLSAEPVIDSMRPYTQLIWQKMSVTEKHLFMQRLRHLWGVARHRIPMHIHDKIQHLRIEKKLHICPGKLIDIKEEGQSIIVEFYNKKQKCIEKINVSRVINCTGPETDLKFLENSF